MTLITTEGGCKVGWAFFDNEEEAKAAAKLVAEDRERMFAQGYDFGYQWPGSVMKIDHPVHGECWRLVTT